MPDDEPQAKETPLYPPAAGAVTTYPIVIDDPVRRTPPRWRPIRRARYRRAHSRWQEIPYREYVIRYQAGTS